MTLGLPLYGQSLALVLADQTQVGLVEPHEPGRYYYLPVNLRLATQANGHQELSFLAVRENQQGPIQQGILHWLFTWGLTAEQEAEVDSLLKATVDSSAALWGAVALSPAPSAPYPHIYTEEGNPLVDLLHRSQSTQSNLPTFPGGKWAASYRFDAEAALQIQQALEEPEKWGDARIQFTWLRERSHQPITLEAELRSLLNHP